jgi:hypothetical protein
VEYADFEGGIQTINQLKITNGVFLASWCHQEQET